VRPNLFRRRNEVAKKRNVWVVPHEKGWAVKREGSKRAAEVFELKEKAVAAGRKLAKKHKTELIVQAKDGSIQSKDSYGAESTKKDKEH
jgi:uncharacterized protein YdaT